MPAIHFSHPQIKDNLIVSTGANNIAWSYTLNTQTYPTYAGEVVQILSTAIENIKISGEVRDVADMEAIYKWFLLYMQKATQGNDGTRYTELPVKMQYPERGWTLYIQPTALPGLHYGRDVVVPTWELQAHVIDADSNLVELTIDAALNPEIDQFKNTLTADIGFRDANPYSDPLGVLTQEEATLFPDFSQRYQGMNKAPKAIQKDLTGIAKQLAQQVEQYVKGNFSGISDLMAQLNLDGSKPADPQPSGGKSDHEKKPGKKK